VRYFPDAGTTCWKTPAMNSCLKSRRSLAGTARLGYDFLGAPESRYAVRCRSLLLSRHSNLGDGGCRRFFFESLRL